MAKKKLEYLISSLSKSEIRSFIWVSQRQKGNHKYILLFQSIRKGNTDPKQLAKKLGISESQVPVYKNYLKKLILKSLSIAWNSQPSLYQMINEAQVLKRKGMEEDQEKILKKAFQKADEEESFIHWFQLQEIQGNLRELTPENSALDLTARNEQIIEFLQLKNIRLRLRKGFEELNTPGPKISLIDSIVKNNPILAQPKLLQSIRAKAEYYKIKRIISIYKQQYDAGLAFATKYVELREVYPEKFQDGGEEYIQELGLMARLFLINENYRNAFKAFKQLDNVIIHGDRLGTFRNYLSLLPKLNLSIDLGWSFLPKHFNETLQKEIKNFKLFLPSAKYQMFLYTAARYFVIFEEYNLAKKLIWEIINHTNRKERGFRWEFARFLLLIVYCETNDHSLLESLLDQLKNYYRNNKPQYVFQKIAITLFDSFLSINDPKNIISHFLLECNALLEDPFEKRAFDLIDLKSWAESKLNAKSWRGQKKISALPTYTKVEKAFIAS